MAVYSKNRISESDRRLMMAIGAVIEQHTAESPMRIDEIVSVLGFCAGAAIINGAKGDKSRRNLRELAAANIESGMNAMVRATSGTSLILPGELN